MDRLLQISRWLAQEGRLLATNSDLFQQFCEKIAARGVPLDRSWLHLRALHPQYAGVSRIWTREAGAKETFLDHGFEMTRIYLTSTVRFAVEERKSGRWRLDDGAPLAFPILDDLRAAGYTDYVIAPLLYSSGRPTPFPGRRGRPADSPTRVYSSSTICCRSSPPSPRSRAFGGSSSMC